MGLKTNQNSVIVCCYFWWTT